MQDENFLTMKFSRITVPRICVLLLLVWWSFGRIGNCIRVREDQMKREKSVAIFSYAYIVACTSKHSHILHVHNITHQDHEIQVYGYKSVGDPQCLWTFTTKDSVLALTTELEGGRVSYMYL